MSLIEVNQIYKSYGFGANYTSVLDNISFSVDQGEFVGIMGPSGAGKSTLLNIISTMDTPSSGEVFIRQQRVSDMNERELTNLRKKEIGFIFQNFSLMQSLSVEENISLPLLAKRTKVSEMKRQITDIAGVLGISGLLDKRPNELSIGQQQRVSAARAIVKKPEIILADEPTGSLDSRSATDLLQFLENLNTREKMTILMVTHDAFTASYCKRILFIKDGQIFSELIRSGSRSEFFEKIIDMQSVIGGGKNYNF